MPLFFSDIKGVETSPKIRTFFFFYCKKENTVIINQPHIEQRLKLRWNSNHWGEHLAEMENQNIPVHKIINPTPKQPIRCIVKLGQKSWISDIFQILILAFQIYCKNFGFCVYIKESQGSEVCLLASCILSLWYEFECREKIRGTQIICLI